MIHHMFALLSLAVVALSAAPAEPLAGQLRSAIWSDLGLNALIGSGNWVASLWYNAGSQSTPNLHIRDLRCDSGTATKRCSFILFRDGGVVLVLGKPAPDRLACDATFIVNADEGGWAVKHTPPRGAGHSQTTMKCEAAAP